MEAAVFNLTFDGLSGEGEIGFDSSSLTGAGVEIVKGSDLTNGYFNWYLSGEGWQEVSYPENQQVESYPLQVIVSNDLLYSYAATDAFNQAYFDFNNGQLVGISNYSLYEEDGGYESHIISLDINDEIGYLKYWHRSYTILKKECYE
ncbi:MAG: hypothetical protein QNJ68_17935 [Microcoleaceae cyanobacterium MO_207.B10]|nr:hypothetical protein [Microcoleaceae cyanobacterium MO_207.B10]